MSYHQLTFFRLTPHSPITHIRRHPPLLLATVASVVIGVVIAMAITHGLRWKVSLHLGGIAGSVTVFVLLFGPILLVLSPLVALVGWARWRVGAHTVAQAIVATILAVVITAGTFWVMHVPVVAP